MIFQENVKVITLSGSNKKPSIHSIRISFAGGFNDLMSWIFLDWQHCSHHSNLLNHLFPQC